MISNATAVKRYFEDVYPRPRTWRALPFRSQSQERLAVVENWLPSLPGKTMCDVGCGDGEQIRRILSTRSAPSKLTLQDISARAVDNARLNLAACGVEATCLVGDAIADGFGGPHDIVIATGVADYYLEWEEILHGLLQGTNQILILDFPRKWKLRNIPRRIWLRSKGLTLKVASKSEVIDLVTPQLHAFEIAETKYNWFVKICKCPESSQPGSRAEMS